MENLIETNIQFKVESFRKIPNPYSDGVSEMFTAICDVHDLPEEFLNWMETNPRKQNIRSGVAKKIKESLINGSNFHLLNRGILISAKSTKFNNYDNICTVTFTDPDYHGDVDGGHTLKVIVENRDQVDPGKQYVKIEILTGIEDIFEDLAAARNTSTQVKDQSIANLREQFDLIKETIKDEPFANRVYFMENDDGDIDVAEILAILNMFNIDTYKGMDNPPTISFSSKKKCVDYYIRTIEQYENGTLAAKDNPYEKMRPVMVSIFKLYDKLERSMGEYYVAKNSGGKYGAVKGVSIAKKDKVDGRTIYFNSKFYNEKMFYSTPNGFIFPILGAFRSLLKEVNGKYTWTTDPFAILEKVGPELVSATIDRSRTLGNNPGQVGKDTGHWKTLFMRVMFEATMQQQ